MDQMFLFCKFDFIWSMERTLGPLRTCSNLAFPVIPPSGYLDTPIIENLSQRWLKVQQVQFWKYNDGQNGCCLAYIGNTSNLDKIAFILSIIAVRSTLSIILPNFFSVFLFICTSLALSRTKFMYSSKPKFRQYRHFEAFHYIVEFFIKQFYN